MKRAGLVTGSALAATIALAPAAQGATFTVDSTADAAADGCDPGACTLRDAVTAADADANADTITFAPSITGTITLTQGALTATSAGNLTITGPGADVLTVSGDADGSGAPNPGDSSVLRFAATVGAPAQSVSGLTIADGYAQGGQGGAIGFVYGGYLSLDDVVVTDSTAGTAGGGIDFGGTSLEITDSELTGNEAVTGSGGAINITNDFAIASITGTTISGNAATIGGGIFNAAKYSTAGSGLTVTDSEVSDNDASGNGGGIGSSGFTSVEDSLVADNSSSQQGGGISSSGKYGDLRIEGATISGNTAGSGGGGIRVATSPKYSTPSDPAGSNDSAITDSTITDNSGGGSGGGILVGAIGTNDSFRLAGSTLSGNDAVFGGGLALEGPFEAQARVVDSTITGNDAATGGGVGIGRQGGAVNSVQGAGAIQLYNSTIADNAATAAGGGVYLASFSTDGGTTNETPNATLYSSIVGDNLANGSPDDLATAPVTTPPSGRILAGYSLVEEPGTARYSDSPTGSNLIDQDPRLLPLADNGGPTETLLPANVSPALDVGANPLTLVSDQRGLARDIDLPKSPDPTTTHTDMGAVELQGYTAPDTTIDSGPAATGAPPDVSFTFSADQPGSTFECSLDGAVFAACTSPQAFAGLGDGQHTFRVRATSEGVTDPTPAASTFTVGSGAPGAPETTLTKKPKKRIKTRKGRAKVKLAFTSSDAGSTFECKIDKGAFKPCKSPLKVKLKAKPKRGAKHTIAVRAVSATGAVDPTPASAKVKVIRKKPKKKAGE